MITIAGGILLAILTLVVIGALFNVAISIFIGLCDALGTVLGWFEDGWLNRCIVKVILACAWPYLALIHLINRRQAGAR